MFITACIIGFVIALAADIYFGIFPEKETEAVQTILTLTLIFVVMGAFGYEMYNIAQTSIEVAMMMQ